MMAGGEHDSSPRLPDQTLPTVPHCRPRKRGQFHLPCPSAAPLGESIRPGSHGPCPCIPRLSKGRSPADKKTSHTWVLAVEGHGAKPVHTFSVETDLPRCSSLDASLCRGLSQAAWPLGAAARDASSIPIEAVSLAQGLITPCV